MDLFTIDEERYAETRSREAIGAKEGKTMKLRPTADEKRLDAIDEAAEREALAIAKINEASTINRVPPGRRCGHSPGREDVGEENPWRNQVMRGWEDM